ncbi:hypothetical protein EPO15_07675 [bacterium]|nr:MAG: hypothetical protein EPO15_07675 [bacterium]
MTGTRATSAEETLFASVQTLRIEPGYRSMLANEKVSAREDYLRAFDRGAEHVRTGAYALSGLAHGSDILVLRATHRIEDLHAATSLVSEAGLGRHLTPTSVTLGTMAEMPGPAGRFAVVVPLADAPPASAVPAGARMALIDGRGLGAVPFTAVLEGDDPLMGRRFLAGGLKAVGPVVLGLRAEVRDIVDHL